MNYNQTCAKVLELLNKHGYRAINIDYDPKISGPGHYSVTAQSSGVRVIIAYTANYHDLLVETRAYLSLEPAITQELNH